MPKLTIIARVVDGLPLAASMEDDKYHRDLDVYKNQAKRIFKQLTNSSPGRLSIETGSEIFQCARQHPPAAPFPARPARPLPPSPRRLPAQFLALPLRGRALAAREGTR
jgi:hypothetical protein